jgi:hypothetical protein
MAGKGGKRSTTWQKGVSGNPGGRPKLTPAEEDAIALSKQYAPDAVKALHEMATDRSVEPKARAICANSLLDRAFGKPKETTETTVKHERRSESDVMAELVALGLVAGGVADKGVEDAKGGSQLH